MHIYKYEVKPEGEIVTYTGPFYKILKPQVQDDKIVIWAELLDGIDEEHPVEDAMINFITVGTGWTVPDSFLFYWQFAGSVQKDGYVWHVYYSQTDPNAKVEEMNDDEHKPTEEA